MSKKEVLFIVFSFLIWRIALLLIVFIAPYFLPLQKHFLGGGMENYLSAPWFWGWANFDGEHYLSIAQRGYGFGEQAFFPLYPLLIRILGGGIWAGLIISNVSFLVALFGFYNLVRLDFSAKISKLALVLLLIFPTSFYFGSVYTESLFLALVVWSFYYFRKEKYLLSGLLGMFASATRVIGILLLPVLLIEAIKKQKKLIIKHYPLAIISFGLIAYMFYLYSTTGDAFAFLHTLSGFGEQRSATPIVLPQVFYRYIFKILPNLNYNYFPVVFSTLLEFVVSILFLGFSVLSFFRLRLSYSLYLLLGYLVPTLSGSFSSLPRYVLVLFPAFILLALWTEKLSRPLKIVLYGILFSSLAVASALFLRGYWVS